jgi:predicted DNA-binding mobile mystery protein A
MKDRNILRIQQLEDTVQPFRAASGTPIPRNGWIRAIREALGMSSAQLGARLGHMAPQSIEGIQKSEINGAIKLETLRKVANAMGCQLVYAIVPLKPLEEIRRDRAVEVAGKALERVSHSMHLEAQGLGAKEEQRALDREVEKLLSGSARRLWS